MGQGTSSKASDCLIDVLTDDALIFIFSFLSLYERLMILRVSKRYNRLLSNSHSWTDVDFWQEHQEGRGKKAKTWVFSSNPDTVLAFLQRYTSGSLKSIYLKVVNKEILYYLCCNCPNLKVISFLSGKRPFKSAGISYELLQTFPKSLPLPQTIEICQITLKYYNDDFLFDDDEGIQVSTLSDDTLAHLGKCKNLRCLTLHEIHLTPTGITALTANSPEKVSSLSFLQVNLLSEQTGHQLDEALSSLFNFTKLTSFSLSTDNPSNTQHWFDIEQFLSGIGNWKNLKGLALAGIMALSKDSFALMASGVPQLQTLELEGEMITDENLEVVAQHLRNLTCLELTNGNYTNAGVKALFGHSSLERLCLLEHHQRQPSPSWLLSVYDVLLSLPNISYVKLIGNRLLALHIKEKIPKMPGNVKIDVENSKITFEEAWWRDRRHCNLD